MASSVACLNRCRRGIGRFPRAARLLVGIHFCLANVSWRQSSSPPDSACTADKQKTPSLGSLLLMWGRNLDVGTMVLALALLVSKSVERAGTLVHPILMKFAVDELMQPASDHSSTLTRLDYAWLGLHV